jgi:hypothetical protein
MTVVEVVPITAALAAMGLLGYLPRHDIISLALCGATIGFAFFNRPVAKLFLGDVGKGGPVTLTHPDMVRYFMTIREACDLVITAASHALGMASNVTTRGTSTGRLLPIL